MKSVACLVLLLSSFSFGQSFPHIFELRGLEDSLNNTHLFYRHGGSSLGPCWSKSIFHMDIANNIDTLFVIDIGSYIYPYGCYGTSYIDYEFFSNDPTQFIFVGSDYDVDAWVAILRNDERVYIDVTGNASEVEVSKQNKDFLYLLANEQQLLKSVDGGYNWTIEYDSLAWIDYAMISLSHFDDNQIYGVDDSKLVRSEDEGYNYIIVDDSEWKPSAELFYDVDGQHIYGVYTYKDYFMQEYLSKIYVSNNHGNPFTWTNLFTYNIPIRFTLDEYQSGEVYYSIQKNIFKSTNFGNTFILYNELERKITGLYKKSGTNILYASTPLKIYEITPDTMNVIKSLPIPEDAFAWLPFNQGDMWVRYHELVNSLGDSSKWISKSEVVGYKVLDNKVYNKMLETIIYLDSSNSYGTSLKYFRVDSTNGIIYRSFFINDSLLDFESFLMDLMVEVGDTIPYGHGLYLVSEEPFTQFGVSSSKRIFQTVPPTGQQIELVKSFGVVIDSMWQPSDYIGVLKGCIIDETLYGDTILVLVRDEKPLTPIEFSLSQNYPNPFNPITTIKFSIPADERRDRQNVGLKIYDVLGNEIATIVNEEKPAGSYEIEFDGNGLPSGMYFYQLKTGKFIQAKKMVLIK